MKDVDTDSEYQKIVEITWRRPLAPEEEARLRQILAAHPRFRADWNQESALTQSLNRLSNAPVSSNFTARVLQAARRAPVESAWRRWLDFSDWIPSGLRPRLVLGAAMVCVSLFTVREYQIVQRQQQMARNLAKVSQFATLPPVDWLKNFDTIDSLDRVELADNELLRDLQ